MSLDEVIRELILEYTQLCRSEIFSRSPNLQTDLRTSIESLEDTHRELSSEKKFERIIRISENLEALAVRYINEVLARNFSAHSFKKLIVMERKGQSCSCLVSCCRPRRLCDDLTSGLQLAELRQYSVSGFFKDARFHPAIEPLIQHIIRVTNLLLSALRDLRLNADSFMASNPDLAVALRLAEKIVLPSYSDIGERGKTFLQSAKDLMTLSLIRLSFFDEGVKLLRQLNTDLDALGEAPIGRLSIPRSHIPIRLHCLAVPGSLSANPREGNRGDFLDGRVGVGGASELLFPIWYEFPRRVLASLEGSDLSTGEGERYFERETPSIALDKIISGAFALGRYQDSRGVREQVVYCPFDVVAAHELIHIDHRACGIDMSDRRFSPPASEEMQIFFENQEEYVTIVGPPPFSESSLLPEGYAAAVDERRLSENGLLREKYGTERLSHRGVIVPEKIDFIPLSDAEKAQLERLLSTKARDLPTDSMGRHALPPPSPP